MMKQVTFFLAIALYFCLAADLRAQTTFYRGVDLSYLAELENKGAVYKDNGKQEDALDIFKNHGVNLVRLRLWYHPQGGYDNLFQTLRMAKEIASAGLSLCLDIHYSDTWADAGHQAKPAAWKDLSYAVLKDSVYAYTYRVVRALRSQGTTPAVVQIGNEITSGMLYPDGEVGGSYDNPTQWSQLAGLLNAGIKGVKDAVDQSDTVKTMIHIDRGGDLAGATWFFDNLKAQNVNYDIIGLSYYPWWHGPLSNLAHTLDQVAARYHKPVVVAETAYPWTLDWDDDTGNQVGESSQVLTGFPATVDGQKAFVDTLFAIVRHVPDSLGIGAIYWAPADISLPDMGSSWENLTMFDFQGNALASMAAFEPPAATPVEQAPPAYHFSVGQNYPNPFNPSTNIPYRLGKASHVRLTVFNILGQKVATLVDSDLPAGSYKSTFFANKLPSGLYLYKLQIGDRSFIRKMMLLK